MPIHPFKTHLHSTKIVDDIEYIVYQDYYFKCLHDEDIDLISGLHLPDPNKGPYLFRHCEIHPRLWEAMQQMYTTSKFENTYIGIITE